MSHHVKEHGPDPVDVAIGAAIRLRRRLFGFSQEALAEAIGCTFQQVQKYERGGNRVSGSMLQRIADKLECHPGDFFPSEAKATELTGDWMVAATQIHGRRPGLVEKLATLPKHTLVTFDQLANDILGKPAPERAVA